MAAARCNLFSHSLAAYQTNWVALSQKNEEVLEAHIKVIEKEPRKHNFGILKELAQEVEESSKDNNEEDEPPKLEVSDKDQQLFFGDEFSDSGPSEAKSEDSKKPERAAAKQEASSEILIDYDFGDFMAASSMLLPSQLLMDDNFFNSSSLHSNSELLDSLIPSQGHTDHIQSNADLLSSLTGKESSVQLNKNPSKKANENSKWFSLFSDLDPLNQQSEKDDANAA